MSSTKRIVSIGLALCCLFNLTPLLPSASADTITGTLVGRVFDVSSACQEPDCPPLFGVLVQVRNDDKGYVRSIKSDASGTYRLEFIEPGIYTIIGKLAGYNDDIIHDFKIKLDKPSEIIPPPLRLSKTNLTPPPPIQKNPEAVVNTVDVAHRLNVDMDQLLTLPVNGVRTFDLFARLAPGVLLPPATYGAAGPGVGPGVGTSGQFAVNGLRSRSNNFTVDGSDNNDQDIGVRRQGFVSLIPQSIESVNELEVTTLLADAQAGRNFGAQVNAISRTGTNEFHGTIYDFSRSSQLARRNFFDDPFGGKNSLTSNQYGFVVGGPIQKDTTHFFLSYERQDINRDQQVNFAVPLASQRRFLGFDPSQVPSGETLAGKAVLDLFPLPNNPSGPYGANTFSQVLNAGAHGNIGSLKIDHRLNNNNYLTGRYNITDDNSIIPSVGGAINGAISPRTRTQNVSLFLISQLSNTSANEFRFSYGRTRLRFDQVDGSPFVFSSPTGVVDRDGDGVFESGRTGPIGQLEVAPFSPIGVDVFHFPQQRVNNTFQFADTYIKSIVGHTFKAGADIRRTQFNSLMDRNSRPQIVFSGVFNRDPFLRDANGNVPVFLNGTDLAAVGAPTAIFQAIATNNADSTIGLRFTESGFFFQDSWNVRRGLHLELGARYEYNTVPHEAQDKIESTFGNVSFPPNDPTRNNPNDPLVAASLSAFNSAVAGLQSFLAGRTEIYQPDKNNIAPRVGIAWDPTGKGQISIRAGYGIYYDQILGSVVSESRNVFPSFVPIDFAPSFLGFDPNILINPAFIGRISPNGSTQFLLIKNGSLNQFGGQPGDFQAGIGALFVQSINGFNPGNGLAFTLPANNLRTPYAQQYSLTVEKELWNDYVLSVAYVGTKGTKLIQFQTPNLGPAAITFEIPDSSGRVNFASQAPKGGRPEAGLGAFTVFDSSGGSSYNALQISLNKRFNKRLQFTTAYTYSHAIDNVSDVFDTTGAFALPQNSFALNQERASAGFDVRHSFVASGIWDISGATKNRFLSGWQMSGILTMQTGQPFTVNSSIDVNEDGNLTDRLNTLNGINVVSNGQTTLSIASGTSLASLLAPRGSDGAIGRNTFRAPGIVNLDLAFIKNIKIDDKRKFEFRTEIFNAFSRTDFGVPVRILEAPAFGQSVNTTLDPLYLQFALKFWF